MEPVSLGAVFASIGSAFKFADLAVRVSEVGSENEVFVRTIQVVRDDLNEVERLLNDQSVQRKLTSTPGKFPWVKGAITNTKSALNEIGRWVERARSEQQSTGEIRFETRIRWVFSDHEKLMNRKTELMTCHQQLSNVLSYLQRLEDVPVTPESPSCIDTTFFDDVLSRNRRRTVSKQPFVIPSPDHRSLNSSQVACTPGNPEKSRLIVTSSPTSATDYTSSGTTIPANLGLYPETPPYSPPPTYASIMHDMPHNDRPLRNLSATSTFHSLHRKSTGDISRENNHRHGGDTKQTQDIRAYEMSRHNFTPELVGDTVFMSGTNSLGPVNPFDFSNEPTEARVFSKATKSEPAALAELPGSLNFPVELPAGVAGPSSGYPRRPNQQTLSSASGRNPEASRSSDFGAPSVELPAITRRKPVVPVLVDSSAKPSILRHSVAAPEFLRQNDREVSGSVQSSLVSGSHNDTLELPASQRPSLARHSYTPYSCPVVPSNTSRLISGEAPLLRMPSPQPQAPQSQPETTRNFKEPVSTTLPNKSSQQTDPSSMVRMRRQKEMMNLLGSIEF